MVVARRGPRGGGVGVWTTAALVNVARGRFLAVGVERVDGKRFRIADCPDAMGHGDGVVVDGVLLLGVGVLLLEVYLPCAESRVAVVLLEVAAAERARGADRRRR